MTDLHHHLIAHVLTAFWGAVVCVLVGWHWPYLWPPLVYCTAPMIAASEALDYRRPVRRWKRQRIEARLRAATRGEA